MKTIGRVEVPQEAFVAALSTDAAGGQAEEVTARALVVGVVVAAVCRSPAA